MLLVPALQFIQFQSVGVLFASDVLLLAALPVVLARSLRRLKERQVAIILLLGMAWLTSQVVTDMIRSSSPADYLRGWSKIAFTLTHLIVIWQLMRDSVRRVVLYGVGVCVGGALAFFTSSNIAVLGAPWKFGLAIPVTLAVVIASSRLLKRWRTTSLLALVGISAINLYLDFRSLGLICALTAAYTYSRVGKRAQLKPIRGSQVILLTGALILTIFAFETAYKYAVEGGWLGDNAQIRFESQQGGEGGLLLGGRSEILGSAEAILDSPILGHGSWARDSKYAAIMRERRVELGYQHQQADTDDLIPTHSHIFGAWVEAGVLGAFFWFWILKLTASTLLGATGAEPWLTLFVFISLLLCWDILFSPYGAERRFLTTYLIAGVLLFRSISVKMKAARGWGIPIA